MTRSLSAPAGRTPTRRILKVLAPLVGVALLLLGVIALGRMAWDQLRERERFQVSFSDIECTPPPRQGRIEFLDEVQYLSAMPQKLRFLDDDLAERLSRAFARHPLVAQVKRVELIAPRQVVVRLVYRTPVLVVRWADHERVVDGWGVLLPKSTPSRGLPVYPGQAPPPKNPEGKPWGDPAVEAAARQGAKALTQSRKAAKNAKRRN